MKKYRIRQPKNKQIRPDPDPHPCLNVNPMIYNVTTLIIREYKKNSVNSSQIQIFPNLLQCVERAFNLSKTILLTTLMSIFCDNGIG